MPTTVMISRRIAASIETETETEGGWRKPATRKVFEDVAAEMLDAGVSVDDTRHFLGRIRRAMAAERDPPLGETPRPRERFDPKPAPKKRPSLEELETILAGEDEVAIEITEQGEIRRASEPVPTMPAERPVGDGGKDLVP